MRRIITIALLAIFVLAMTAFAGEYHFRTSLSCYQCHTMHYSQQHAYGYAHEDSIPYLGPAGPYNGLLRNEVNELCLSCHDGEDVVDVYGVSEVFVATNREAGFLNKQGDGNEQHGHTLGATAVAPGGTWTPDPVEGLTCANCHSPHGSMGTGNPDTVKGQWRNLSYRAGGNTGKWVNYEKSSELADLTKDIKWRKSSAFVAGAYETENVDFYEPDPVGSRYGAWCQSCHTNFHGNSSSPNMHNAGGWIRHPAAEANLSGSRLTQFKNHPYRPQVMSPTGNWGTQGDTTWTPPTDLTPTCVSCHKGHGNGNPFGLVYLTGDAPRSENGDGTKIVALCKVCHTQGK